MIFLTAGCSSREIPLRDDAEDAVPSRPAVNRIFAQGLIMPSDGIIQLFAVPGDTLAELNVSVGSQVKAGQVLAVMQSNSAILARQQAIIEQRSAAEKEHQTALRQAEFQRASAALNQQQVQAKFSRLKDQEKLIRMGEEQLATAQQVLDRLMVIASDSITSEFVGTIEIDRQKIAVGEARMKLTEQKNRYLLASEEMNLAIQAAEEELEVARNQLALVKSMEPGRLFDLQIEALKSEASQSVLTAPTSGIILAIGSAPGGAATQLPLIEMANTDKLVCEAEVNVVDVGKIEVGQAAKLTSRALPSPLSARVIEKGRLVGRPRLRSPDPLAASDYRTLSVILEIEETELALNWIKLQVDVAFELSKNR